MQEAQIQMESKHCNVQYNNTDSEEVAVKTPTQEIYSELQRAYEHFNTTLFEGDLPPCLLTLQRKEVRCLGYFSGTRFISPDGQHTDEIAMNPMHFSVKTIEQVMGTLVHEMVHLWQFHKGQDKSRTAYHNKEWGSKMEKVGLMPSNTGQPGGKRSGQQMHHYPITDGVFEKACAALLTDDFRLSWMDRFLSSDILVGNPNPPDPEKFKIMPKKGEGEKGKNSSNRVKYSCPCGKNVWGKPELHVICGECEGQFNAK